MQFYFHYEWLIDLYYWNYEKLIIIIFNIILNYLTFPVLCHNVICKFESMLYKIHKNQCELPCINNKIYIIKWYKNKIYENILKVSISLCLTLLMIDIHLLLLYHFRILISYWLAFDVGGLVESFIGPARFRELNLEFNLNYNFLFHALVNEVHRQGLIINIVDTENEGDIRFI